MTSRLVTIRSRTTAAACLVVAIALSVTGVLVLVVLRNTLGRNVVNTARARAEELALLAQQTKLPSRLPDSGETGAVVQVVDGNGRSLAASAQVIDGSRLSRLHPALGGTQNETSATLPITGDQRGDPFRVIAFGAQTLKGPITVYVAVSLDQVHDNVGAVRAILRVVFPVLLLVVGITTWHVVGRALRPVDGIARQVRDIGEGDLARRVPEPSTNDEIGRLARSMNLMLNRLQSSSERQRRFVADASHELQSPLASSLADLEVALAHPDSAEWSEIADGLVADNQRMAKLVGDLLFLAKNDDEAVPPLRRTVDLDDIVLAEVARLRTRVSVGLDVSGVTPVEVQANPEQIARVVRNLLDNAVRYASETVVVQLHRGPTHAELVISDDGPGVAPEASERIFERFARLDSSRSRHTGGSGLGLAIAREIIGRHDGTIMAEPSLDGGRFVVRLPISPP